MNKSTIAEITARFDADVDRFANLETGQSATMDAPLTMELITSAALAATTPINCVLDIGCGAGNNTIKLLRASQTGFDCHLNDLSAPMLQRAQARLSQETARSVRCWQGDFRDLQLPAGSYDVILAAAVLHHLRDDADWTSAFQKMYQLLRPGGSLWITDLVAHQSVAIDQMMWQRYADYLTAMGGKDYQEAVFAYIEREDSPRSLTYQINLLQQVGFVQVDVLHKNGCFAAFGGIKPA